MALPLPVVSSCTVMYIFHCMNIPQFIHSTMIDIYIVLNLEYLYITCFDHAYIRIVLCT